MTDFENLKYTKFNFGWGSVPDHARGAHSAPPDSLAGFGEKGRETRKGGRGKEGERVEETKGGENVEGGEKGRGGSEREREGGDGLQEGEICFMKLTGRRPW